jgi:hypothetical protein
MIGKQRKECLVVKENRVRRFLDGKPTSKSTSFRVSKKKLALPEPDSMCQLRKPGPLDGLFKVTSRYLLRRMNSNVQCIRVHCFTGSGSSIHVDLETFHSLFTQPVTLEAVQRVRELYSKKLKVKK